MSKHTPEPWVVAAKALVRLDHAYLIESADDHDFKYGATLAATSKQDARRIVACVNACAGVETETLEGIAGKGLFSLAIEAVNENEGLKKQCDQLNTKIDQAWGRSSYIALEGFIPGAFDAWKQPVKQFLPYDFSGNPGSSATQYCNGWNDAGGYWLNHARDLKQQRDELLTALHDAATSLETIQLRSFGQDSFLDSKTEMRSYAGSRAAVAREAIDKVKGGAS